MHRMPYVAQIAKLSEVNTKNRVTDSLSRSWTEESKEEILVTVLTKPVRV